MRVLSITFFIMLILAFAVGASSQSGQKKQAGGPSKKAAASQPAEDRDKRDRNERAQDEQASDIKLDSLLVMVPVVASDRNGLYVPDLKQAELSVFEDAVEQEVVFFATVEEPFHVVLMLDTSASAREKLKKIKEAASAFVDQLKSEDRVKVIAFDDSVRELAGFTNNRAALHKAIEGAHAGQGTRVYDAVKVALARLDEVKGRKAIVIFTDGVDMRSQSATYEQNTRALEESGVIVYPIRYDTRAETEAIMREQQRRGQPSDIGVILGGPPIGTTPPTVPGDSPVPRTGGQTPPWGGTSIPPVIVTGPRRNPRDNRYPDTGDRDRRADPRFPDPSNDPRSRPRPDNDDVKVQLDNYYTLADHYLNDLASVSGGKLHRADTLGLLAEAFGKIGAELRTQYALGYYSTNTARDGSYRKIRVHTTRKEVLLRARPGYRAPE